MNAVLEKPSSALRFHQLPREEKIKIAKEWAAMDPTKTAEFYGIDRPAIMFFAGTIGIRKRDSMMEKLSPEQSALINDETFDYIRIAMKSFLPRYGGRPQWAEDVLYDFITRTIIRATKTWKPDCGRGFNSYWYNGVEKYVPHMMSYAMSRNGHKTPGKNRLLISMDQIIPRMDDVAVKDRVESPGLQPDIQAELNERIATIRALLTNLNKRTAEIISIYYGIEHESKKYQEIGDMFGITRERVRQIIKSGFTKIRKVVKQKNIDVESLLESLESGNRQVKIYRRHKGVASSDRAECTTDFFINAQEMNQNY